jgi:hypothetical protein
MRFMMMVKSGQDAEAARPPSPEYLARMGKFYEEMTKAGVLVMPGGLLPISKGARLRSSGGKITVTDGPFTEAKELVGGFAIIEAQSKEEAIESGRRFLEVAGDLDLEIRQMMGPSPQ